MSNRNFDSRVIIQRLKEKNQAQNLYGSQVNGKTMITNPQNSDPSPQTIQNYKTGSETTYWKGLLGGAYTADTGAVANYFAAPLVPPSAPTNLVGTPSAGQVSVAFTPGAAGSSPITNYLYSIDGGATFVACDPAVLASPVIITGLTTGNTYSIALRARTSVGSSPPSALISVLVAVPPSAPVLIRGSTPGNQQTTFSFTQGSTGGSPITNYQYSTDGGVNYILFSPALTPNPDGPTSATILYRSDSPDTRLSNNQTYIVKLKAVNAAGVSVASNSTTCFTYMRAPAPTSLSSTAGNASVQIAFSQSTDIYMGPITNYDYSTDGENFTALSPQVGAVTSITITGLANNTTYQVQLRALNAAGASVASQTVSAATWYVPAPPVILNAVPGNGQATINFTQELPAPPITNYEYSLNSSDYYSTGVTASPAVITGLTNGVSYTIYLRAVNLAGTSTPTYISNVIPAAATPGAPTITSLVGGDQAIYILYTAGSTGGSAITNYQYSIDGGTTFTALSPSQIRNPLIVSDSSLVNGRGTPYDVVIQAINAGGAGATSNSMSVTPQVNTLLGGDNLIIQLDAGNAASYPGTGSTWTNLQPSQPSGPYNATLENGPIYSSAYGGILTFDGTNQVATISDGNEIDATTSQYITAQVWTRVKNTFGNGNGIIGKQWAGSNDYDGYSLSLRTNGSTYLKMNGASVDGTYSSPTGEVVFTTDTWTLFTAVVCFGGSRSSNPSYTYIDPFRVATGNNGEVGIPRNTAPLQFPRGINEGTYNYCPADIGQIFYYNRNLTQEEIIRNYDATKSRYAPI